MHCIPIPITTIIAIITVIIITVIIILILMVMKRVVKADWDVGGRRATACSGRYP